MTSHENQGFFQSMFSTVGRALKRGVLGKSSHEYAKQLSGSDEYWDRAIRAQLHWPEKQPPNGDPDRFDSSGAAVVHDGSTNRTIVPSSPQSDYKPVY